MDHAAQIMLPRTPCRQLIDYFLESLPVWLITCTFWLQKRWRRPWLEPEKRCYEEGCRLGGYRVSMRVEIDEADEEERSVFAILRANPAP